MIKKIYFGMILAAGMLASACTSEDEKFNIAPEDAAQVTFTVGLQDGIATRAISDGTGVNKLVYAVYDANGDQLDLIEGTDGNGQFVKENAFAAGLSDNVSITLAKGQEYTILFWAQNSNCTAYRTTNLQKVGIDYTANNNDETRDAFCAKKTFTVSGDATEQVTLKRPFAQINVGVTEADWNAAVNSGIEIEKSKVVIKQAASTMNIMTGAAIDLVDVTYELAEIPTEELTVNGQNYKYLSMSYILANDETDGTHKTTLDEIEFTFAPIAGEEIVFSEGLNNVPVQRNYRTNIIGKILTGDVDFEITIDPIFEINKEYIVEGVYRMPDEPTVYYIDQNVGMAWVYENVAVDGFAGKTLKLDTDIDLEEVRNIGWKDGKPSFDADECSTNTPIGSTGEFDSNGRLICEAFKGTFDGQGNTIENLYQSGWDMGYEWGKYGSIGLFAELEDATVKNVVIKGMEAQVEGGDISFIAGSATGTCVFENITITDSKIGTYNNGIGGIIGWSGAGNYTFKNIVIGEDVVLGGLWGSFDSSIGGIVGQAEPGATYNFENVEINCRIDAYNDCTASYDYYNYRMCGMVIGRCEKTTEINGSNYPDISQYNFTFNNVVVNYGTWMNYHYCEPTPGHNNGRGMRIEAGYAYGGLPADFDHSQCVDNHYNCIPFDQLIGGAQSGVKGLRAVDGITVNYPAEYTCTLCGGQHNAE